MKQHIANLESVSIPATFCCILGRGRRPSFENLNDKVVQEVATKWRDLGGKLLGDDSQKILDIIAEDNRKVAFCFACSYNVNVAMYIAS